MRKPIAWSCLPRCPKCFKAYICWGKRRPLKRPHAGRVQAIRPQIGSRTLLAASCLKCGKFFQGNQFSRRPRKIRDRRPYLDLRCANCKWGAKVKA
jgi:hypothetical protein